MSTVGANMSEIGYRVGSHSNGVQLQVVPEPSAWAMLIERPWVAALHAASPRKKPVNASTTSAGRPIDFGDPNWVPAGYARGRYKGRAVFRLVRTCLLMLF